MTRLLIIADHSFVVQAIRLALRQTAGFRVVGFVDGRSSVRAPLLDLRPDVVLLDEMQNPEHPLERLREVVDVTPEAKALLLTQRLDEDWVEAVFEAGADAVLSKAVHPVGLGTLLRETVRGNIIHRHRARAPDAECPLTSRELEILQLAAQGYTNGRIARRLWIAEHTVKFHLANTYRKLGVANRTEASTYMHAHALAGRDESLAS
jgi:DNA-binding NarL/FixJ family response regulator